MGGQKAVLTTDQVRLELLAVWGRQACQVRPDDWPQVLQRLLRAGGSEHSRRAAMAPAVEEAVAKLG